CLRSSRRPPFPVAVKGPGRAFAPAAVLLDGERLLVVERAAPDRWRLVTYDVRRRRAAGPAVSFATPAGAVGDAATADGRVAIVIGDRLWLIGDGTARILAETSAGLGLLWIHGGEVGWLEGGASRRTTLSAH
ncbi:MAG TPA: hypothetical protein VGW10_12205, partial [Solirubrobacteraceae bacterium]|nr:hypothetical protein [Solirubrobacteraceae bacterium]